MNRHVNAVAARLSLRLPQRESLEILDRVTEILPPRRQADLKAALDIINSEFPSVTDFERAFPSLCFAIATGVGKTRLMGAFIAYLYLAHGMRNFFVLAPNLTIYDKLIADFTPGHRKYVFKGISEFAVVPPEIITGDNWESRGGNLDIFEGVTINIFNISKLNQEAKGVRQLKLRSFRETLGKSYFSYLAATTDLVLIMDESHRYRGDVGTRALDELKPVLGLEVTATPFVEKGARGAQPFKNVVFDYPLARAIDDGFVKIPAVVTRKDFRTSDHSGEALERLKIEDGLGLHEQVKVHLATYAAESGRERVKPFVLIIARDTTHAAELKKLIESLYDERYAGRVIQVDSSSKDEEVTRALLAVEHADEPTEIVIHVNMLKEGWDVTNLYTIIPLRAANARTLVEQSIGRGLRLPFGQRTGVLEVDRLNIIAHDRFQEIVDDARRPDSPIRLQTLVLDPEAVRKPLATVVSRPNYAPLDLQRLSYAREDATAFSAAEQVVAALAVDELHRLSSNRNLAPTSSALSNKSVQALIVQAVQSRMTAQLALPGTETRPNVKAIVAEVTQSLITGIIDIPRIVVTPKGKAIAGYRPFEVDLTGIRPNSAADILWVQRLDDGAGHQVVLSAEQTGSEEARLEDYLVRHLINFKDVDYFSHADLLYDLASQTVRHLETYLPEEEVESVLRQQGEALSRLIHGQMQAHYQEGADEGYEAKIHRGWTELKPCAYTIAAGESPRDFRQAPPDLKRIATYLFGGFQRCLYPVQKFHSNPERLLAVILDRDTERWFRPTNGQFQIRYRRGLDHPEYVPDFVAETTSALVMLEVKAANQLGDQEVNAKAEAAREWARHATEYTSQNGGKPWKYLVLPHDIIQENMSFDGLSRTATSV